MNLFKNEKILVTCALPYSNGPIHIGHLLEHIQADIWVRYKKYNFCDVKFICSDDSHGTSIILKSKYLKINPIKLINIIYINHLNDLKKFNISYDMYYKTHSLENKNFLNYIYKILLKKELIFKKYIYQFYDDYYSIFLSDRLFKSKCKVCLSVLENNNYCNYCNNYYDILDIINPISLLSYKKPILKKTKHIFFKIYKYKNFLKSKIKDIFFQNEIINKINEIFDKNILKEWDISRDKLYFGFKIPNEINKYFYVWIDAITGYISTFIKLCKNDKNINFYEYWNKNSKVKLYQFIGKDIVYFHSIFWLSILKSINFRITDKFIVHGHLIINGKKMSKSLNNFISAKDYINSNIDTDYLRYFYASKLSNSIKDINFNTKEFYNKINNVLINKILNIPNRIINFIIYYFNGFLSSNIENIDLYNIFIKKYDYINYCYDNFKFNIVIITIEKLSDIINEYINNKKPWNIIDKNELHDVCTMVINLFKIIFIYLKPILPNISKKIEFFLGIELNINFIFIYLINIKINNYFITKKIKKNNIFF